MNLTRMDHEGCRGWWVRIQRGDQSVSKLFSDGIYGSTRKAEIAATKFRDEKLKELPARVFKGSKGPRLNAAGYYLRTRVRRGKDEQAWVAIWTEDGRQLEKSFSINQHGNAAAKKLAKAYRQEMVEKLISGGGEPAAPKKAPVKKKTTVKKAAAKKSVKKAPAKKSTKKAPVKKKAAVRKAAVKKAPVKKAALKKKTAKKAPVKKVAKKAAVKKVAKKAAVKKKATKRR
ncbi:AP2 domain protein [Rosistilla carotiformis]|uniref:AP2 domain protein n=1 Tax=Rosistilla carotiformis TaxID=2528017 RepID=A0A518JXC7_9BACT|nr:AP2 domain-containing protein [Rosistilla carotiformis]QDV70188.1 AP2 domain protein [Rosistilla carotiformis]